MNKYKGGESSQSIPDHTMTERQETRFNNPIKTVRSSDLFGGQTEIGILHDELLYRLRITKQGKLILTK